MYLYAPKTDTGIVVILSGCVGLLKGVSQTANEGEYVLDFFAGSGTTGQAVLSSEHERHFILTEMGTYFNSILKLRIKKVQFSKVWKNGFPIKSPHRLTVLKVQSIEQYEDLLDNLQTTWDDDALPSQIPVKYLFRPEQNKITSSLDLSRPFEQQMQTGKSREEKVIDLMETWLYLQGYWVKSRRVYRGDVDREYDRTYLAVETTHGVLVLFRDIDDGEDDTDQIQSILAHYVDDRGVSTIQRLELNHDADMRKLNVATTLIAANEFMRGAQWS